MASDPQEIWGHVLSNLEAMREHAPAGYEPFIHVYVAGRAEPFEVGKFETRDDLPWTYFMNARHDDSDLDQGHPDDLMLFVAQGSILGIELSFRRSSRRPIGFSRGGLGATKDE